MPIDVARFEWGVHTSRETQSCSGLVYFVFLLKVRPQHLHRRTHCGIILRRGQQTRSRRKRREHLELDPNKIVKTETTMKHGETFCMTCRNGWRSSLTIQWTEKLPQQGKHRQAALMSRLFQNRRSIFRHFPKYRNCEVC